MFCSKAACLTISRVYGSLVIAVYSNLSYNALTFIDSLRSDDGLNRDSVIAKLLKIVKCNCRLINYCMNNRLKTFEDCENMDEHLEKDDYADFEPGKTSDFLDWFMNLEEKETKVDLSQSDKRIEWVSEFIPGLNIASYGGIVPFQAEGLIHNLPFYYRDRGSTITLKVNHEGADNAYGSNALYNASAEAFDGSDMGMNWLSVFFNLMERLDKSPYLYEFEAKTIRYKEKNNLSTAYVVDGHEDRVYGWGYSAAEAYESTKEISSFLTFSGFTEEIQKLHWELQDINPIPVNEDDRIYPDPEPSFTVNVPDNWRNSDGMIEIPADFLDKMFKMQKAGGLL